MTWKIGNLLKNYQKSSNKKKIAIIGAGFFGISAAFFLKKKFEVTIFEKSPDILTGASRANQLRFHLGYHYPRSKKTLNEVQSMNKSFVNFYGKNVFGTTKNYYGVAKKNSKTSFLKYKNFLYKNKLFFKLMKNTDFSDEVNGTILSKEKNLNFFKIKKKSKKILIQKKIKVKLNRSFLRRDLDKYYKVIIACYDKNNEVLKNLGAKPRNKYKFELVEKIVIKLPKRYQRKSFMVLDGKFVSLDPYIGTKYHLLSDVQHSKIEVIKNFYPKFRDYRKKYLNKGLLKLNKVSNFKKFILNSSKYLPFLNEAKYIGSFFVTRAIELNKEKTDERINSIKFFDNKFITIFSGKWNTAVGLAKFLLLSKKI